MHKTYLNDNQIELANSWLASECEAYAYNNQHNWLWFRQPHYSGVKVNNSRKLTALEVKQLDRLRSCQCGSNESWVHCQGHPDQSNAFCG